MTDNKDEERFQKWKTNKLCDLKYHRAVCMLAAGIPFDSVAEQLGVSVRTVERWFKEDDFNHDLKMAIDICFKSSVANAAQYINRSIDVLTSIIENQDIHVKYRLAAIRQLHTFVNHSYEEPKSAIQNHIETLHKFSTLHNLMRSVSHELPAEDLKLTLKAIWERLYSNKPFPEDDNELREYWNRHRPI